mgnify:CR=1 FL=1
MNESKLLVSIITPVFNSEKFLRDCLNSVINQTFTNWEMILVDDSSSDNSVEIVKEYVKKDSRFKFYKLNKNSGSGVARNLAIEKSKGDIIAFLDSDDVWVKDKLKKHLSYMEKTNASFSHTSYGFINEDGEKINKTYHVSNFPITYEHLLKRTEISCLTAMYDVRKIGKRYMPDLRRKQDYALWLSILKDDIKAYPLDEELAFYRQVKGSATNNKFKLVGKHYFFLRNTQGKNIVESLYYTFIWGTNGIKKYYLSKFF